MLKIIIVWWTIGAVIMVAFTSMDIKEDIKEYGIFGTILGHIFTGFAAPVWFTQGIVKGIIELIKNE